MNKRENDKKAWKMCKVAYMLVQMAYAHIKTDQISIQ